MGWITKSLTSLDQYLMFAVEVFMGSHLKQGQHEPPQIIYLGYSICLGITFIRVIKMTALLNWFSSVTSSQDVFTYYST